MKVIMPVHVANEEILKLTQEAIASLKLVEDVPVIIIDNGSEMGGGYLRFVSHIYIRNKENLGFAKAVNQGLKVVDDEYVAIVNNDIRVSPNWLQVANDVLLEPKTYSCHPRMTEYDIPFDYGTDTVYKGKERWCQGSFFVLRRLEPIFYDEEYLNSYDDWDFFQQIRSKGYKTAYTDKACFQHAHSTTQKLIPQREDNNFKNREYFKKKWGEYAEDLFNKDYFDQMKVPYAEGFKI